MKSCWFENFEDMSRIFGCQKITFKICSTEDFLLIKEVKIVSLKEMEDFWNKYKELEVDSIEGKRLYELEIRLLVDLKEWNEWYN